MIDLLGGRGLQRYYACLGGQPYTTRIDKYTFFFFLQICLFLQKYLSLKPDVRIQVNIDLIRTLKKVRFTLTESDLIKLKLQFFSLPSSLNTDCVTVCRKMHCNSAKKDPISFCSPCYFSWLYENLFSLSYQKRINRKDKLHKIGNLKPNYFKKQHSWSSFLLREHPCIK